MDAKPERRGPGIAMPERYEDRGPLATGGFATVRRVHDKLLETDVAMKILRYDHIEDAGVVAKFENEARITAMLSHPSVIPVHDRGRLPDGRPWFTMKMVEGETFRALLADRERWPLRRLVEALTRVCQTVGYAHRRGVVHRDLKPDNLMVGAFGEVLVMDWGIARLRAELEDGVSSVEVELLPDDGQLTTRSGDVLGTVAYMSPEQAMGKLSEIGPPADVFALGLILWEILFERRAYRGRSIAVWGAAVQGKLPAPPFALGDTQVDLLQICERATHSDPDGRYADAALVADDLRAWLEGDTRRARAAALMERADAMAEELSAERGRLERVEAEARRALAEIQPFDPVEDKRAAWTLEDDAEAMRRRLMLKDDQRVELLRAGLEMDPEHAELHARLAVIYRRRVTDAEARRDPGEAARWEQLLRRHDRGEHRAFLSGEGALTLTSRPAGAEVVARRLEEVDRRLVPGEPRSLGPTPVEVVLAGGSYLLELRATGHAPTTYPVSVRRGEVWPRVRRGDGPIEVALLADGALAESEVYVPAGPAWTGGDARALEPLPLRELWIEGFVAERFPVTNAGYLAFLNDLAARGHRDRALAHAPRRPLGRDAEGEATPVVLPLDDGTFALGEERAERPLHPDAPVAMVSWFDAVAYAAWRAERDGLPWRLPYELEWEKLARGVDGRRYPWGDFAEPTFAAMLGSREDAPRRLPVDTHPEDVSPYGARGFAGNVRCWCMDVWTPEGPSLEGERPSLAPPPAEDERLRSIRGGCWSTGPPYSQVANRFANRPHERLSAVGLRLVRPV